MRLSETDKAPVRGAVKLLKRCEQGSDAWKAAALSLVEALGPLGITKRGHLRKSSDATGPYALKKKKKRRRNKTSSRDNLRLAGGGENPAGVQKKRSHSKKKPAKKSH
ncbi:hypothetical protein FSARC_5975 [Fusarium sarcochroum]|uniref:Uncharacterized protein n=1 Tax=Fusarium sarcochroum TaxID=1208366 RepID=A0A8H4X8Z7_9HYPO|nr:hypothetical protein FSARC_5975 [Fusarium sarcochroum]